MKDGLQMKDGLPIRQCFRVSTGQGPAKLPGILVFIFIPILLFSGACSQVKTRVCGDPEETGAAAAAPSPPQAARSSPQAARSPVQAARSRAQAVSSPAQAMLEAADEALRREDYDGAAALYRDYLEARPEASAARYRLGYALGRSGDRQAEIRCYEKALQDPAFVTADRMFNLGMACLDAGRLDQSLQALRRGLELDPSNPDIFFGLGLLWHEAGDYRKAEAAYLGALTLRPADLDAGFHVSLLYLEMGRRDDARRHLLKILDRQPDHIEAAELLEAITPL